MQSLNFKWLLKMAWRDSRRNTARLLLFISSIILGIASLVAINSFSYNLQKEVQSQSKSLLGADLVIEKGQQFPTKINAALDSLGGEQASEKSFASMVFLPKTEDTRLVQIRALEGNFPFYGKILTEPETASTTFKTGKKALLDKTLMLQFDVEVGDSVKIGNSFFTVEGKLKKVPGQASIAGTVAPVVYIPLKYMSKTGLERTGSRIQYSRYFKFDDNTDIEAITASLKPEIEKASLRMSTIESRRRNIGEAFSQMNSFLNLVAFVALLLGCVGVASSVSIYSREKIPTTAILRCLGAKGNQAMYIFLIQIAIMGFIGSILGALLGSAIQVLLPVVFKEFLPLSVSVQVSPMAMIQGVIIGLIIAILFALLPLLSIRKTSPLRTLRAIETDINGGDWLKYITYGLIGIMIYSFAYLQIQSFDRAIIFTLALGVAFLILAGVARLIMFLVKRFFPVGWNYIWRQSLANLYRPNNQTLILIVTIGLGTALISTLFFVQGLLINQVAIAGSDNQPNMILFDIQPQQSEAVAQLAKQNGLPIFSQVPIITTRLYSVAGRKKTVIVEDKNSDLELRSSVNREYRVTFRDSLIETEKIIEGQLQKKVENESDKILVSVAKRFSDDFDLKVGDELSFNIQGTVIETEVGSIRDVDWAKVTTNFNVVFPLGVLEEAPQFNVLVSRTENEAESAQFQRELVKKFPNVSVVDLTLILQTVDDVLSKVSFVIQFMALFSIITGLLVLIGSVIISKFQRIKESVLLRTLGAQRKQILQITALEYFFLGSLASLTGIGLSLVGSWLLAYYSFETIFIPKAFPILTVYFLITTLTIIIGLFNSREVLNRTPLEVLRSV